jgi:hypothetical protein
MLAYESVYQKVSKKGKVFSPATIYQDEIARRKAMIDIQYLYRN